jgi:oligopeptide/dipeptide ABC transporter ATP-binding protein
MSSKNMVVVKSLTKHFELKLPWLDALMKKDKPKVRAVDELSFTIKEGEALGLVGESGSGKTTVGRSIIRLIEPTSGTVEINNQNIVGLKESELRRARKDFQIIFQDPMASLNPYMTIGKSVMHPLEIHNIGEASQRKDMVLELFEKVNLIPSKEFFNRYPRQLSGGQRQRVVIARAIITNPKFIVSDEATAMLDVSVRSQVLKLMLDIKKEYNLAFLFITHDLASAKYICEKIAVMYLGKIVEIADTNELFTNPSHPYTKILMSSIPIPDPKIKKEKIIPKGEIPSPTNTPTGCRFRTRCPFAKNDCEYIDMSLRDIGNSHLSACPYFD